MSALNRKLARDLRHSWLQVLAIALVIGCGAAVYVMLLGTLTSLEETRAAYYERYRFAHVFASVKRAPQILAVEIARIPGVATVETRVVAGVPIDIEGFPEPVRGILVSVPEGGQPELNRLHVRQGRDIARGAVGEAILNEAFANAHGLQPGDRIAAVINGRRQNLTIVGIALSPEYIFTLSAGAMVPDDLRFGVAWIGRETLETAYDLEGAFNDLTLRLSHGASEQYVIDELDRILEPYGSTGAYGRGDQISHWFISNEMTQLRSMVDVAPPVFLAVAAFLLHIVVSRLVMVEREQIGLLKSFGYSNAAVAFHYIKFVVVIVLLGTVMGFGVGGWLGRGLTEMYTEFFRFPFLYYQPEPGTFVLVFFISVGFGMLGALGAARSAARLPPAVAMQPASPPVYRRGIAELLARLAGLDQSIRMIIRNLTRRPVRAGLTILGIAMSAAIFISSTFMIDSIEEIIDVQFNLVMRQDLSVSLATPQPDRVLDDIAHMPGVLRVEPARILPVRIWHGHKSRRLGLIGTTRDADLVRRIDTELGHVNPPPEGLALTEKLASVLDVGVGDRVYVQVKEGKRSAAQVPVTAIVQDYLGMAAYMEISAANRLAGEGPMVSIAYLQIDKQRANELYRTFVDTPGVSGVAVEETVVESFRDTMAEHLLIMVAVNMMFAGLIAFGVVYNSARIALSERGRELASLRVLGFTKGEVSLILLGEFTLLTFLALLPGFLIGYGLAWSMTMSMETELFRLPLVIGPRTYGLAAVVILAAAVVTGLVVRRRIGRFDLVGVLKTRE